MSDATRPVRAVDGPPPGAPLPSGPGGPGRGEPPGEVPPPPLGGGGPDWRRIVIGGLVALIVLLALVLVLVRSGDDDGDDLATDSSTTSTTEPASTTTASTTSSTTSSTSSTTSSSTTSSSTSTTTTTTTTAPTTSAPPATVVPARCTGRTGPQNPDPVAQVFYDAWTLGDRACAERVATEEAIEDLFVFPGEGADWSFEGCMAVDDDPPTSCVFRYEGGSAALAMGRHPVDGWKIQSVTFTAD